MLLFCRNFVWFFFFLACFEKNIYPLTTTGDQCVQLIYYLSLICALCLFAGRVFVCVDSTLVYSMILLFCRRLFLLFSFFSFSFSHPSVAVSFFFLSSSLHHDVIFEDKYITKEWRKKKKNVNICSRLIPNLDVFGNILGGFYYYFFSFLEYFVVTSHL